MNRATALIACLLLATATPSLAAPGVSREDVQTARIRSYYERGIAQFKAMRYAEAIADFKIAYAIAPSPILLFNIAQSHRLLEDYASALDAYREYLRQAPDANNRADVRNRIAELERLTKNQPVVAAGEARTPLAPPAMATVPEPLATRALSEPRVDDRSPTPHTDRAPMSRRAVLAPVIALGVVGALSLAAGGGLSFAASRDARTLEEGGTVWSPEHADRYAEGRRMAYGSYAAYAIGGTALVTSALIAIVGRNALAPEARRHAQAYQVNPWRF